MRATAVQASGARARTHRMIAASTCTVSIAGPSAVAALSGRVRASRSSSAVALNSGRGLGRACGGRRTSVQVVSQVRRPQCSMIPYDEWRIQR
jgi:hypothetical protein